MQIKPYRQRIQKCWGDGARDDTSVESFLIAIQVTKYLGIKPLSKISIQAQKNKTFYERWSWWAITIACCFAPLAFFGAGKAVESNVNKVEDWLPKSFSETRELAWFRDHFACDQFIIISWNGCLLSNPAQLDPTQPDGIDDPRIAKLATLLSSEFEAATEQDPETQALLTEELRASRDRYFKSVMTGRQMLDRLTNPPLSLSEEEASKRLRGTMVGPDSRQTCVVVTLKPAAITELKKVLGRGQRRYLRPNLPPGALHQSIALAGIPAEDVHLGGPPVDNAAIDEEGERTLVRLAGLSGLLGLFLAWWSLRSVLLTCIVFSCGVLSAAVSLANVWITGENIDAILMSMPSLVYVLAISGAVHLISYYRSAVEESGLHGAVERAVLKAWKPAVLCSVTTAVGLLSLVTSELVPIRKFGIYSAAGVMTLVAVVFFLLPAALQVTRYGRIWIGTGNPEDQHSHITSPAQAFWEKMGSWIVFHHRLVFLGCILFTVGMGYGLRYSDSSIDLLKLFDSRAKILQDYRWLEANLGKLVPLEIVVRFPTASQKIDELENVDQSENWQALSFLDRMETVARIQKLIDNHFGPAGSDETGQSMSAATFAPVAPAANSGLAGYVQRKTIAIRLRDSLEQFQQAGFLSQDVNDGSELWRVSLRVAAFRDIDYGTFVSELKKLAQPAFDAHNARRSILLQLSEWMNDTHPTGARVYIWSSAADPAQEAELDCFASNLAEVLANSKCKVIRTTLDPKSTSLTQIDKLNAADAVILNGDFSQHDVDTIRSIVPHTIDARFAANSPTTANKSTFAAVATLGPAAESIDAVYTGVVPIVYQAQRALLRSLIESTWWSFLTITPIMIFVSRSVFAGSLAMVPNVLPVLVIFGGMGWLQIPIDIGSMMTASIALGVAVDDTIHFLAKFRQVLEHSSSRKEAIIRTYGHCAVPTLQAAVISGLGLSVFAFSTFTPTQKFGWLMLTILFAGIVSELVMLPALLASRLGVVFETSRRPQPSCSPTLGRKTSILRKVQYHLPHSVLKRKLRRLRVPNRTAA